MTHTPGPWTVETSEQFYDPEEQCVAVVASDGTTICDNSRYYPEALDPANAHLIAAAPDLLAALKPLVHRTAIGNAVFLALTEANAEAVLAAIAKAEGR